MGIDAGESQRKRVPIFEDLVEGTMQAAAEGGAADEQRALSYLVNSYPVIYEKAAESYGRNFLATELEIVPLRLTGERKIMDVIFSFTNYDTNMTEKYRAQVDVTEESPTLVTELSAYSNL